MTPAPKDVALSYLKAFETKDLNKARSHLHFDGHYSGPMSSFRTADTFVPEMSKFMQISKSVQIIKAISEGPDVCVLWDYETIVGSIPVTRISNWFRIEDGKVREMHLYFNPVPFIAAMEKGQIAEALAITKKV
jgi:hypothetical protein